MDGTDLSAGQAEALEKHLMALRQKFLETLAQKEEEVEEAVVTLAAYGLDKEIVARLYYTAHNLVGMAPMHKFHGLAEVALRAETLLVKSVMHPHVILELDEVLIVSDDLAEEIRITLDVHLRG